MSSAYVCNRGQHGPQRDVDVPRLLEALGIDARREGEEWWACCPLGGHPEEKASWSIRDAMGSERHGLHSCFGCARGGTPADLVLMRVGLSSHMAALDWIERRSLYDDSPTLNVQVRVADKRPVFAIPVGVHIKPPAQWPATVWQYAAARGITADQAERWSVGYALEGRLAGRIVFPIVSFEGRDAGYMARAFDGREPKYLTPDRSEGPLLSVLWGEQHWPEPALRSRRALVVCEGAINALACERAGAANLAVLSGSHIDRVAVAKVGQFGTIVIAVDNDAAGDRVAAELTSAYARWRKVRRVMFPSSNGKKVDAADMAERSLPALRSLLWSVR